MITVTLYSRADCHLCAKAMADLNELQSLVPHKLIVIDVDSDIKLARQYGFEVPVVDVGPYTLKAPIEKKDLEITLRAAQDRVDGIEAVDKAIAEGKLPINITWTKSDRLSFWLSRHYLALFNIFLLIYLGIPFLAPVLMENGATAPARLIYRAYGAVCHEFAFRSFFLFGEQLVYPRTAAGLQGLITYGQASGLNEGDIWAARQFTGSPEMGYKVALCERDVSIYFGLLAFGVVFGLTGRRHKPMHWAVWILLGLVPIGLDGVSQLISQPPLNLIPYRESTPFLRILTGLLFGISSAWFAYPNVEISMQDTRRYLETKLRRLATRKTAADASEAGVDS